MKIADLVKRTDELIDMGKAVLDTKYTESVKYSVHYVRDAPMAGFRSASLSFIERVYGREQAYFNQFSEKTDGTYPSDAERAIAILTAIRSELAGGWLFTVKGLVAAELFSDILDQAENLLHQGYKDAAAVMIGSILEEHLRQLCIKNEIPINDQRDERAVPRKANLLNEELARSAVYTALDSRQVTAWLKLRNDAAHGKYDQYTQEQVKNFFGGVVDFMSRVTP